MRGITRARPAAALALAAALVALAGCSSDEVDLEDDIFVGTWSCGEATVALTTETITVDEEEARIAYIETAKNADYGLFTTRGAHYSVFDARQRSMTFHDHGTGRALACERTS